MAKVAVLLGTYNGSKWLMDQLESIFQQKAVEVRVLAFDDGSSDGTAEILRKMPVKLCAADRVGSSGANFVRALKTADIGDATHVALADQDDIWLPDKLSRAVEWLDVRVPEAVGYSSAVTAFWESGDQKIVRQGRVRDGDFLFQGAGQGCTFVLTAAFFQELQDFLCASPFPVESITFHDWLIYCFARARGRQWVIDKTSRIMYRQHASNAIGVRAGVAGARRRLQLIAAGWYRGQVALMSRFALSSGIRDGAIRKLAEHLSCPSPGFLRRCQTAGVMLRYGRRKLVDRILLGFAFVVGIA